MTWRRLDLMAGARQSAAWERASPVMVLLHNHFVAMFKPEGVQLIDHLQHYNPHHKDAAAAPSEDIIIEVPFEEMRHILAPG